MGEFLSVFFELLGKFWWLILLTVFSPYFYFYLKYFFKKNSSQNKIKSASKINDDDFINVKTEEEKLLGINVLKSELPKYNKRIENLISTLTNTTGRVSVNAIEAILIVEHFSDKVELNELGELVIDIKTVDEFCKKIYDDPMAFIIYLKSVENKIDLDKKNNEIEFGTILYMMRNAKKFGLYSSDSDNDFTFKIKSAIHEANYKDVVLNIQDINDNLEGVHQIDNKDFILVNTNKDFEKEVENFDKTLFKKVEKVGEKIKITTHDDYEILKDDIQIYSIKKPNEAVQSDRVKLNQDLDIEKEIYIEKFGSMDSYEKESGMLRDRSRIHFEKQLTNKINFDISRNKEVTEDGLYFFETSDIYYCFLANLFSRKYAFGAETNYVFLGERELKNKTIRYLSVDAHYLFCLLYLSIKRKYRESFFKFIFEDDFKINFKNANIFIDRLNSSTNIFYGNTDDGYFSYAIYKLRDKNIKSIILRVVIDTFQEILKLEDELAKELTLSYLDLKKSIDGECESVSFGQQAEKNDADVNIKHSTFFRIPSNEMI